MSWLHEHGEHLQLGQATLLRGAGMLKYHFHDILHSCLNKVASGLSEI